MKLKDGRIVLKEQYIKLKTLDLIEFWYETLTETDVSIQLEKVIGNSPEEELNIIGMFILEDIR